MPKLLRQFCAKARLKREDPLALTILRHPQVATNKGGTYHGIEPIPLQGPFWLPQPPPPLPRTSLKESDKIMFGTAKQLPRHHHPTLERMALQLLDLPYHACVFHEVSIMEEFHRAMGSIFKRSLPIPGPIYKAASFPLLEPCCQPRPCICYGLDGLKMWRVGHFSFGNLPSGASERSPASSLETGATRRAPNRRRRASHVRFTRMCTCVADITSREIETKRDTSFDRNYPELYTPKPTC